MEEKKYLAWDYCRRFGVEIEINSFDNESKCRFDRLPEGIYQIGSLVSKTLKQAVILHAWDHDHNNNQWVIKPDGSCGMEVCSPVSKGWHGLRQICEVIEAFGKSTMVRADKRCSVHVHIEVADLTVRQIAAIAAWWIKVEPVFLDSVPNSRKNNRYCQFIGLWETFDHDSEYTPEELIAHVGETKYGSFNTFHHKMASRQTVEFRIMDAECCRNPYMIKNWIRLLVHFVEIVTQLDLPIVYEKGNPWSGYCWLDPKEVFQLLKFDGSVELSPGMMQVKEWFLDRLLSNSGVFTNEATAMMGKAARSLAYEQYKQMNFCNIDEALYDDNFKI